MLNVVNHAAKSLQSCPTLCDPIDGSPPGSPNPWDSPGKNTGVGCHCLLQCMKVERESEVAQLCPTLCDPVDCSLPGSSIHGIFQARVLEWGAIAFCIVNHEENANQNHNEISPHTCHNSEHQITNVVAGIWGKGNSCTLVVGMQIRAAVVQQYRRFFKN